MRIFNIMSAILKNNIVCYKFILKFFLAFITLNIFFNLVRIIFTDQDPIMSSYEDPKTDIPLGWPISVFKLRMPYFLLPLYSTYTTFGVDIYFENNPLELLDMFFSFIYIISFIVFKFMSTLQFIRFRFIISSISFSEL